MDNKKVAKNKNIQALQRFLKKRVVEPEKIARPKPMSDVEISAFFNNTVMPAYETLKKSMVEYNLETIRYKWHTSTATFKIAEPLYQFFFKVEINNLKRELVISPTYKYRSAKREKLKIAKLDFTEVISFKDIEKITSNKIISLFSDWFINKDEQMEATEE